MIEFNPANVLKDTDFAIRVIGNRVPNEYGCCPDCGKQQFSGVPALREATGNKIDKYNRIKIEIAAENKIPETP